MRYSILENNVEINTIEASLEFVTEYCEINNFTYEELPPIISEENQLEKLTKEVQTLEESFDILVEGLI